MFMFMSMPVLSSRRAASPFSLPPLSSPNMTLQSPTLVFPTTVVSLSALFSILKQGLSDVSPSKETSLSSPTPLVLLSFFSIVEVIFFFFFFSFPSYNLLIILCYVMLCNIDFSISIISVPKIPNLLILLYASSSLHCLNTPFIFIPTSYFVFSPFTLFYFFFLFLKAYCSVYNLTFFFSIYKILCM